MSNQVFLAGRFSDDSGKVDDSFYTLEGVAKDSDIPNVTTADFDFPFYFLERLFTPKKFVKNPHFVAASEELLDYAGADVARTPGYKYAHDIDPPPPPSLASGRPTHTPHVRHHLNGRAGSDRVTGRAPLLPAHASSGSPAAA
jgi:hypothetical protein